ncbi:hypothetical protein PROFUN_07748 [Planoprotostelium fungivorum]|uniref:PAS domain-containing protein n=1 Tax=Planoprotostelium fungivorum TaxID=1890364 RepID=A0A2P6N1F6_9EUKA|nr:hypothetical protein PROFUN_07748 [Planoprotostelium fungivorum]
MRKKAKTSEAPNQSIAEPQNDSISQDHRDAFLQTQPVYQHAMEPLQMRHTLTLTPSEIDEWSLLLGSSPSSGIDIVYSSSAMSDDQPPSLYIRPPNEVLRLRQLLESRLCIDKEFFVLIKRTWDIINTRVCNLAQFVTLEQRRNMVINCRQKLHEHTQAYQLCPTPTIIWERSLRILYVNDAFKKIVDWKDHPVPTETFTELVEMLSPSSVKMMRYNAKMFLDVQCDSISSRVGFRKLNSQEEVFTEGNGILSLLRDQLSLPEFFVCQFIPDPPPDVIPEIIVKKAIVNGGWQGE